MRTKKITIQPPYGLSLFFCIYKSAACPMPRLLSLAESQRKQIDDWLHLKATAEIRIISIEEVTFPCTLQDSALLNPHPKYCLINLLTGC